VKRVFIMLFFVVSVSSAQAFEIKPYMGIGLGSFNLEYLEPGLDHSGTTWGVFVKGGADFNRFVGAELRLGRTGERSTSFGAGTIGSATPFGITTQVDYFFSYLGKPHFSFNDRINIYGLAGGTAARFRIKPSGTGLSLTSKALKTAFSYGLGAQYKFAPRGVIGVEWVAYSIDTVLGSTATRVSKGSLSGFSITIDKLF